MQRRPMEFLLSQGEAKLDGFMLPGHVCVVAGYREYERFPVPQVVAGFEPDDILLGLLMLVKKVKFPIAAVPPPLSPRGSPFLSSSGALLWVYRCCSIRGACRPHRGAGHIAFRDTAS